MAGHSRRDGARPAADVKQLQHHAEKLRIAEAAAELIKDGETIILDSGTTTAEIARRIRTLSLKSINVITNALNIAALLIDVPSVRLIVPGGILQTGIELAFRAHGREPPSRRCRRTVSISAPTAWIRRSGS